MYDAIIVGARCAGASTAMLLGRKGYKVLLVDRAVFPKDIPHGHFIHRHGPQRLARWGLLDRITATNCPAVTTMTTDFGDFALTGHDLAVNGVAMGIGPRRTHFDKVLVDAAVEAGVELRDGFTVEEFTTDGDRITGIRGRDQRRGALVGESATITIGADGRNSRLAQAVAAPMYEVTEPVTCWYFSYWSDVPSNALNVFVHNRRVIFAFPTNDNLYAIFVAWPADELNSVRTDVEAAFMSVIGEIPTLAALTADARRVERFYGATDLPNFFRKPYGPGWALVGDAGCHKDPYLALGICDALRDAEFLVDSLDKGLNGEIDLNTALAAYEEQRNAASMEQFRQNLYLAQFKPMPPEVMALRQKLRDRPADTHAFYLANQGMTPRETFFNPENMQRIMAA
ncbi:MAG: NAD(P)/FAD-dependent oxidoreductase [Caldilineaceae bacterium]